MAKVKTTLNDPNDPDRLKAEQDHDNKVATRTSRYDQDLKERARAVGINPDNFEEEHLLGDAVRKVEENNANKAEEK